MKPTLNHFFDILADNKYHIGNNEISDGSDNRDEIVSETKKKFDDDGHLPDSLRYVELNGKSTPSELKDYLEKLFQKVKKELIAEDFESNENVYSELLAKLNHTLAEFKQAYYAAVKLNDKSLVELYDTKFNILKRVNEFIHSKKGGAVQNIQKSAKDKVYYFTVEEEFTDKYDIYLNRIFDVLKNVLKFIDCTPSQFKNFFRPAGKTRNKTPEPIIWLSGAYSHLAFFIKCLVKAGFVPNTRQPSFNQIAKKLFYDVEGKPFETSSDKSDVKDPSISPYAEIKQMVDDILNKNKPTF